ncbi:Zeta_toxin domain-containing protein [Cephalotus follicularis]|uniref:Zeta_toxin domain-containing protein n=1 Tax=Cephalotus follicularis TaxID=3775 RepID=A0A1Q3BNY3_CEPFO|nr:Zeta_toxin domain-containing protein [Cephalotus follicularis]
MNCLPSQIFNRMSSDGGGYGKVVLTHVVAASFVGALAAVAARQHRKRSKLLIKDENIIPLLDRTESGRVGVIERFPFYMARQLGFADASECPQLCKLAFDYLKKSKGCEDSIYEYLSNEPEADSLYVKLIQEFEVIILSYFSFHWSQASLMVSQVLNVESDTQKTKLKAFVMAATRKQRFERVTKDLKVTRMLSTLVEEMKAIGLDGESKCTEVMVPVALSERSPVLLLMGGGMGAGKSTVLKDIMTQPFWSGAAAKAVVVEADAFKETDVIYRALKSRGHHNDMLQTAELVHQSSTDAASSLLVTALNEGRDVIMDGTLSWEPFVEQTIAMARNVHKCRYRMGVGYKVAEDGTVNENYWEQVDDDQEDQKLNEHGQVVSRKPYRIELVGVVCDAYLAVVRGIRRAIMVGRAVRVGPQLKSHKRFANGFQKYCQLVDNARLYSTNAIGGPPRLIAWKEGDHKLLIDPDEIKCLYLVKSLNADAESIYELHADPNPIFEPGSVWKDDVMAPDRPTIQKELRTCIRNIESTK